MDIPADKICIVSFVSLLSGLWFEEKALKKRKSRRNTEIDNSLPVFVFLHFYLIESLSLSNHYHAPTRSGL